MKLETRRVALLVALMLQSAPVHAQSLASRVVAVKNGVVELQYAGRSGICGDGLHFLSFGGSSRMGEFYGDEAMNAPCLPGPVRVRMRVQDGVVRSARAYAGPLRHARSDTVTVTDLGAVAARDAAAYFLQLASASDSRATSGAVVAAVLADSSVVWRQLLAIARDGGRPKSVRTDAAFWLSRFAAARIAGHPEDLAAADEDADDERSDDTRSSAVFALSQLRNGEGIEPLIQVARTNRDQRLRRKALFWLGQSGDSRGLDLMEEMLK